MTATIPNALVSGRDAMVAAFVFPDGGLCFDVHGSYVSQSEYVQAATSSVSTIAHTTTWDLSVDVITQRFLVGQPGVGDGTRWVIETCVHHADTRDHAEAPEQHRDEKSARVHHDSVVARYGGAFVLPRNGRNH